MRDRWRWLSAWALLGGLSCALGACVEIAGASPVDGGAAKSDGGVKSKRRGSK